MELLVIFMAPIVIGGLGVLYLKASQLIADKREVEALMGRGRRVPWKVFLDAAEKVAAMPLTENDVRWMKNHVLLQQNQRSSR